MRREALSLIALMFAGTFQMAACESKDERAVAVAPAPRAELGAPSAAERKEGAMPVQGQVDPKEQAQKRDFEKRTN